MLTAQNSRHRQIHNRLICLLVRSIRSIHGHLLTTATPSSLLLRSQEMNWKKSCSPGGKREKAKGLEGKMQSAKPVRVGGRAGVIGRHELPEKLALAALV